MKPIYKNNMSNNVYFNLPLFFMFFISSFSSFALAPTLTIENPRVCGQATIRYNIGSGNWGYAWAPGTGPAIGSSVVYDGSAYVFIQNSAGTNVFSYSEPFTGVATTVQYASGGSTIKEAKTDVSDFVSNLFRTRTIDIPAGTSYKLFVFISYYSPFGFTEGSSVLPAVTLPVNSPAHVAPANTVSSIQILNSTATPTTVNSCIANWATKINLPAVSGLLNYTLKVDWAYVGSCASTVSFNLGTTMNINSYLASPATGGANTFVIPDIKAFLTASPFGNPTNYGNYYKLRFTISNGVCAASVTERCVHFTNAPNITGAVDIVLHDNLGTGANKSNVLSAPVPGYTSVFFQLANPTGSIESYDITLQMVNTSGIVVRTVYLATINLSDIYINNPASIPPYSLTAANIPAIGPIGWAGGTNFFSWAVSNVNYRYYKLTITAKNACGTHTEWTFFKLDPAEATLVKLDDELTANSNVGKVISRGDDFNSENVISEEVSNNILNVYPNPSMNEIIVDGLQNIENVGLYDLNGRLLLNKTVNFEPNVIFNTEDFASGIYLIKCVDKLGQKTVKKVIKL